jgi:flagellar biosynthetic protein FliR
MIFLGLNLHFVFINAISQAFELIPLAASIADEGIATIFINTSAGMFTVAIQLAAPIMVALLFTMAALGLVARSVPQMNVFTLSFPVNFFVGLMVYLACFPFFPSWVSHHFGESAMDISNVLRGMIP